MFGGGEAWGAGFDQKAANALVGFGPDHGDVCNRPVRDPRFFTVNDPVIAIANRAGAHTARVRSKVGFGETEAADSVAPTERGDPAFLLIAASPAENRVHDQRCLHRHEGSQTRIPTLELAVDESVSDGIDARKIEVGIWRTEEVEVAQLLRQLTRKVTVPGPRFDVGEHPFVDPLTDRVADHPFLFIEHFVDVKEIESIELFHDSLSKFGAVPATGYHRTVKIPWSVVAGWYHAALLTALVWVAAWKPGWAPVVVAAALAVHGLVGRTRAAEPWTSLLVAVSAATFLLRGGWELALGWLLFASLVAAVARALPRPDGSRPDAADYLAIGGWGVVFALAPRLIAVENGGWLAPALLVLAAQRIARTPAGRSLPTRPGPPSREIRGTLSLNQVVVTGADALPRSVPIDLDLRAGDSIAILCDSPEDAADLADVLTGRRAPHAGEIMVDGTPFQVGDSLTAVVAPGEEFIPGDLVTNLAAFADQSLERGAVAAVREACSLNEVVEALRDRSLERDGSPLTPFHRLLVLVARVIPSSYRLVVVVDPMPWVNAVRGELWRSAVVRASVGRTAIWLTPDRDLAARANQVVEYRQGALRST